MLARFGDAGPTLGGCGGAFLLGIGLRTAEEIWWAGAPPALGLGAALRFPRRRPVVVEGWVLAAAGMRPHVWEAAGRCEAWYG